MKRYNRILAVIVLLSLVISNPVMASTTTGATFRGQINVVNSSYASADNAIPFTLKTQNLIDLKYVDSDLSNVVITDKNGADVPFMPAAGSTDKWILYEDDILQNATNNYYLYTGGTTSGGTIRYFPNAIGMTVADAASLEPGNNFELEAKGFFDTTSGSNKYIVQKSDALDWYVSAVSTLTANIYTPTSLNQETLTTADDLYSGSITRAGQHFTNFTGYITSVQFYLEKAASPTGTGYARVYKAADGSLLATLGSIDVSTLTSSWVWYTFNTAQLNVISTDIYVVFEYSGGSVSNYVRASYNTSNTITGAHATYTSPTWTDTAGDACIKLNYSAPTTISAAGQTSGAHDYILKADGTNFQMYDGATLLATTALSGVSVPNNASNWVDAQNGAMLYVEYIKHTVGGTLKGHWYWENALTFTDHSGNGNTATPTFRTTTTDADVTASLVSFAPINPSSGGVVATSTMVYPITSVPADPVVSDVSPANLTNVPYIGLPVHDYLEDRDIPEGLFTYPMMILAFASILFAVYGLTRDLGWMGASQFVLSGLFIAWKLLPWPAIFFFGVVLVFCIIKRRSIAL